MSKLKPVMRFAYLICLSVSGCVSGPRVNEFEAQRDGTCDKTSEAGLTTGPGEFWGRAEKVVGEGILGFGSLTAPAQGTVAPDFDLTPLRIYDFKIDESQITTQNAGDLYSRIKLSSFRGKRPVVLIFGSYT